MRQRLAGRGVEMPGNTPAILPELWLAAGEVDAGAIPISDQTIGVRGVNGIGQFIEDRPAVHVRRKGA